MRWRIAQMFEKALKISMFLFVVYFGGLGFIKPSYEAFKVHRTITKMEKTSEGKSVAEGREELKAMIAKDFPVLANEDSLLLDVTRAPGNSLAFGVSYEKQVKVMSDVNMVSTFNVTSDAPFLAAFR